MPVVEPYSHLFQRQVVDLILSIQQKEFSIPITINDQPDLLKIEQVYQQGNGNFWLALDGKNVLGTVALRDIGNSCAGLYKMFVHKDYRGPAGVSQMLLQTVFDWAEEKKLQNIYLGTIDKFQAAIRFYHKHGFQEITADQLPSTYPRMRVDNRFFRKVF